jgi:hypothetical protein
LELPHGDMSRSALTAYGDSPSPPTAPTLVPPTPAPPQLPTTPPLAAFGFQLAAVDSYTVGDSPPTPPPQPLPMPPPLPDFPFRMPRRGIGPSNSDIQLRESFMDSRRLAPAPALSSEAPIFCILCHISYILYPISCTLYPISYILYTLCILYPTSYILHPQRLRIGAV